MGFKCGVPAGDDTPTNTEAEAEEPSGTHNPYAGSTYTPGPSPNAAGGGIAGRRRGEVGRRQDNRNGIAGGWIGWGVGWGFICGLIAFAL